MRGDKCFGGELREGSMQVVVGSWAVEGEACSRVYEVQVPFWAVGKLGTPLSCRADGWAEVRCWCRLDFVVRVARFVVPAS